MTAVFAQAMVSAQQVRVEAPVAIAIPLPAAGQQPKVDTLVEDPGVQVEMFENPNLDRYLRRAQSFLDREDYSAAIQVLQDVIEGKTVEVVAGPDEEGSAPAPAPTAPPAALPNNEPSRRSARNPSGRESPDAAAGTRRDNLPDARNSVFSQNGRLFRPVRRLCHELLAHMPEIGIELYRASYEVAAEDLLRWAMRDGAVASIEAVANRYFVTLPAGRAMVMLADRLMHEGRYRAAVLVLRDLVEIYPAANRRSLGISEVWCHFKIALCLRLAGEVDAALTAVKDLAAAYPDESLRILGQLESIKDLPTSQLFLRDVMHVPGVQPSATTGWLSTSTERLIPLWQIRFRCPEPYKDPKPGNNERFFSDGGNASAMPFASRYGPATWVTLVPAAGDEALPQALFLEHFRLRQVDAASGLMLAEGKEIDEPQPARENQPRIRIAAADFALLRPIFDDARDYVVLGHKKATSGSVETLKASELVACERGTLKPVWSSTQWLDGEGGLRDVTFLAAPTIFGERLLLPALRRASYSLECIDRNTGRPLWNTALHGGGSPFFKAPGCPVKVQGGIAFVATNAGCIAAVDAFAGDLRWIRRYERRDPRNPPIRRRTPSTDNGMGWIAPFSQSELPGFLPNDMIVQQGLLVFAACDSDMLLCLDSASGEPVWWVDGTMRYGSYGKLRTVVGTRGDDIFVLSDTHLVCISLSGGLLRWSRDLPALSGPKTASRGRGAIVGDHVLVPGEREIVVFTHDGAQMHRLPLPAFDESRDPLHSSFNITSAGPWLAIGYQGGVEMFSSPQGLQQLAADTNDPLQKAGHLMRAGNGALAEATLTAALKPRTGDDEQRSRLADQLLALVRERASRLAASGDLDGGLVALDAVLEFMPDRRTRLAWHLVRVELCRDAGGLRAHETEQQRLYDYMEGKG